MSFNRGREGEGKRRAKINRRREGSSPSLLRAAARSAALKGTDHPQCFERDGGRVGQEAAIPSLVTSSFFLPSALWVLRAGCGGLLRGSGAAAGLCRLGRGPGAKRRRLVCGEPRPPSVGKLLMGGFGRGCRSILKHRAHQLAKAVIRNFQHI